MSDAAEIKLETGMLECKKERKNEKRREEILIDLDMALISYIILSH